MDHNSFAILPFCLYAPVAYAPRFRCRVAAVCAIVPLLINQQFCYAAFFLLSFARAVVFVKFALQID